MHLPLPLPVEPATSSGAGTEEAFELQGVPVGSGVDIQLIRREKWGKGKRNPRFASSPSQELLPGSDDDLFFDEGPDWVGLSRGEAQTPPLLPPLLLIMN